MRAIFQRLEDGERLRRQLADKELQVEEHLVTSVAGRTLTLAQNLSNSPLRTPPRTSHEDVASIAP